MCWWINFPWEKDQLQITLQNLSVRCEELESLSPVGQNIDFN